MSKRSLMKSTGVIGAATAVSRVLGFIRDIVIADLFGTGMAAQAFVVAFRIPNMLRDLVGEGAVNAAVVPVFTEYHTARKQEELVHLFRVVFNISLVILCVLTVGGIVFSSGLVRVLAPGFIEDPAKLDLTIRLNRVIFPYILLIGLTALTMGALNTLKHFAAPAFGSCFLNIALIACAVMLGPKMGIWSLALGVLAGGILQLGVNIPVLYRKGLTFGLGDGFRHPAVRRIGRLLVPRVLGSAVYQITIFVNTMLASLAWIVGAGGVAALYYANRLIQFPLGIFSIALAQAALPKMSREAAAGDIAALKETVSFSLRMVMLIIVPSSTGLAFLGGPIIRTLFQRGQFDAYSTTITQDALFFYAFGLVAYSGIKILVSCFYAMHDTKTPVKTAGVALGVNVALNIILMWPLKLGGLALATSLSATLNFVMLYVLLRRRIGSLGEARIVDTFLRALAAGVVSSAAALLMLRVLGFDGAASSGARVMSLGGAVVVGIIAYALALAACRVREVKDALRWVLKKR